MMTTLPSFLASATSFSQPGAEDCARARDVAPAAQSASVSESTRNFFILSSHQLFHPKADFLLVQDKIPIVSIEIVHAGLGDDLGGQETFFMNVVAGRDAAAVPREHLEAFFRCDPVDEQPGGVRVRCVVEQYDLPHAGRYDVRHAVEAI